MVKTFSFYTIEITIFTLYIPIYESEICYYSILSSLMSEDSQKEYYKKKFDS